MKNRRNFIKAFSRLAIAAGLTGMGIVLSTREPGVKSCDFDFPCGKCKKQTTCNDPKAQAEKRKTIQNPGGKS
jgi:hypothetical protein